MTAEERGRILAELRDAFGVVTDVTPGPDQPLHMLLANLPLPPPWSSPADALARFTDWPRARPEFWIDPAVVNQSGEPPRSSSVQAVLGGSWRQFSFAFPWAGDDPDPVRAIMLWLTRFRETT